MGENFEIRAVEAVDCGALIQVDFRGETTGGRMFIPIRDVLKALNNRIMTDYEEGMKEMGFEKEDPNAPVSGLID